MSYVFQQQVPFTDIAGLLVGYAHYHFNDNLKPDSAVPLPPAKAKGAGAKLGGATKKRKRSRAKMATMADIADANAAEQ